MTNDLLNVVRYGWDQLEQEEGDVDSTDLVAGHLVEKTASGYQPHSADGGGVSMPRFAKDMRGRGYEVGDSYPDGEFISYVKANGTVGLTGILAAGADLGTASNATVDGDAETELVSAGDGTLRARDGDPAEAVVAVAKETKDNSGAAAGETELLDIEVTR
jgi:hypothetical protein